MNNQKFNVFIIGPMNKGENRNNAIKIALIYILENLEYKPEYAIKTPEDLVGGYIPNNVFYEMDLADLVIADITFRSPNVFYEIAMLQSMGTPIICVDFIQENDQPIPFYLNQTNVLRLDNSEAEVLREQLKGFIHRFLDPNEFINYRASVISQYYGLPLIDISAVMGVAFGYYTNFIRPFLKRNTGAIAIDENNVSELIIIKPTVLDEEDECKKSLKRLLSDATKESFTTTESTRGVIYCPYYKDMKAYDVPATLFTLRKSPQIRNLRNHLHNLQNVDNKLRDQVIKKYEEQVIKKFFDHLRFLIDEEAEELNRAYFFLTLAELKS